MSDKELRHLVRNISVQIYNNLEALLGERIENKSIRAAAFCSVVVRLYLTTQIVWKRANPKSSAFSDLVRATRADLKKYFKS
jgi:hypothetical protein